MFASDPQEQRVLEPARFIYGHPQHPFQEGQNYNFNGYMYRYMGLTTDEFGQQLPFLELVSAERVAPGSSVPQQIHAPKPVLTPHETQPYDQLPTTSQQPYQQSYMQSYDQSGYYGQPYEQPFGQSGYYGQPYGQPYDQSGYYGQPYEQPESLGRYGEPEGDAQSAIQVKYDSTWTIQKYAINNVIQLNGNYLPPPRERTHEFVSGMIEMSGLLESLVELQRKQPLVFIVEVKRPLDSLGDHYAVAFDTTSRGYKSSIRKVKDRHLLDQQVLCVDEGGIATPQKSFDFSGGGNGINVRVLLVAHNGWLIYFGKNRPWILTEYKYLVFTSPKSQVLNRGVFDTKRSDGKEIFIRQTLLSAQPPVDGMTINTAIVQRDTANDGTFVVIGDRNSIIALTQIQTMINTGQSPKNYFDKTPLSYSRALSQAPGPSTGAIPKRR